MICKIAADAAAVVKFTKPCIKFFGIGRDNEQIIEIWICSILKGAIRKCLIAFVGVEMGIDGVLIPMIAPEFRNLFP